MKIWKAIKYILLVIILVILGFGSYIAYQAYDRFCWFALEDNVVHSYAGVIQEIEGYVKKYQSPPETLSFVSAEEMAYVEGIKEIVKTDYYVIPERNAWKLDVLVQARGKDRQFVYVSDGKLTPDEETRYYVWCHDWVVLTVP